MMDNKMITAKDLARVGGNKTCKVCLRMTGEERQRAQEIANSNRITTSDLIRALLNRYAAETEWDNSRGVK